MKAKDYFNREIAEARMAIEKQEQNLLDDVAYGLYKDFAAELQEIAKKRNVKFDRGIVSTVKELNAKARRSHSPEGRLQERNAKTAPRPRTGYVSGKEVRNGRHIDCS